MTGSLRITIYSAGWLLKILIKSVYTCKMETTMKTNINSSRIKYKLTIKVLGTKLLADYLFHTKVGLERFVKLIGFDPENPFHTATHTKTTSNLKTTENSTFTSSL